MKSRVFIESIPEKDRDWIDYAYNEYFWWYICRKSIPYWREYNEHKTKFWFHPCLAGWAEGIMTKGQFKNAIDEGRITYFDRDIDNNIR